MKVLLYALLLNTSAFAQPAAEVKLTVIGRVRTQLEEVWKLVVRESGWTGQVDCQGFFHNVMVSKGGRDYFRYVDEQECRDWAQWLRHASPALPLCMSVGEEGLHRVDCATGP